MINRTLESVVLIILVTASCGQVLNTTITTPVLVEQHGYPVEEHTVPTSDGYILTIHRIPYSPKLNNSDTQRPVALLVHGILCSSSCWVLLGPERSLAYLLSDVGYDVWLANVRGNLYSKKHVTLSPLSPQFWNFSWHEIGIYDLPATIDYALNVTGEKQVRYFGHSQGTTSFMVLNTITSSYKDRIRSGHFLGPAAFMSDLRSLLFSVGGPLFGQTNQAVEALGNTEFLPSSRVAQQFTNLTCADGAITQDICANILLQFGGGPSQFFNKTTLPEILSILPAGSSTKQYLHYSQVYNSKKFRQFDYGVARNLLEYGTIEPPDYNLTAVAVPVFLYYSDNDYLVSLVSVNQLINGLRGSGALKGTYRVPYPDWGHLDYLFGNNVTNIVYSAVMEDMTNS